jgi:ectoine hydroxylase
MRGERLLEQSAMRLTEAQIERFHQDGFLVLPNLFSADEVGVLRAALPRLYREETPANIREKRSGEVRTAMGLHLRDAIFAKLVRHPRLIEPAFQLLGDRLYVQQVKVNTKAAFEGEVWQWHYDFATHHAEDGVPAPLALNLHVFLDDVVDFNGPLYFIPGSHKRGPVPARLDVETTSYPLWVVECDTVAGLVAESGRIVAATGPAGTALIFGDCLVHASPPNLSPWDRAIFSVIVNPVANAYVEPQRPDFKHHRDLSPVAPLADDCLRAAQVVAAQ